jgi:hypothetical protein
MNVKTDRTPTGLSLDSEVLRKTKILAERNHRNFSNYVNLILLRNIEQVEKEQGVIKMNRIRKVG